MAADLHAREESAASVALDGQLWYYRELADRFSRLLPGRMAAELAEVVGELERVTITQ